MHRAFTKKQVMGNSVRTRRYRYTQWGNGEHGHELYESDPEEYTNLANKPAYADKVKEMKAILAKALQNAK